MANIAGMVQKEAERKCRHCWSTSLHVDWPAGDRVCTECGVVDDEHLLDDRPEWREFEDEAPTAPPRCCIDSVKKENWFGGLQPTTLSKYIFGGGTRNSVKLRKKLLTSNHMIERNLEKSRAQSLKNDKFERIVREGGYGDNLGYDDQPESRPYLGKILLEDSELANTAALYSDKWSLRRCLLLYGKPEEQCSLGLDKSDTIEEIRKCLDGVLTSASLELYRACSILLKAGRILQLPESVLNDAASYLSGYASTRDSLLVRGVSTQMKRNTARKISSEAYKEAQIALKDYNIVKQYSALSAAILFLTGNQKGHFRTIHDVCQAIPSNIVRPSPHLELVDGASLVKLKHISQAIAEVKKIFPELTKRSTIGTKSPKIKVVTDDSTLLHNYVSHVARSLRMPPVAETCLHTLVQQVKKPEKLAVRVASLAFFVGMAGKTMQSLGNQSSNRKNLRFGDLVVPSTPVSISLTDNCLDDKAKSRMECKVKTRAGNEVEDRAYEMQRMWNAWNDQTLWWRSLAEISKAIRVPAHKIRDNYNLFIHPQRLALLRILSEIANDGAPLSSILLPQLAIAAPLMRTP